MSPCDYYGEMRDELNVGLPSDRFQVDWHIASNRVATRLSGQRAPLEREHYTRAGAVFLNPATLDASHPRPSAGVVELSTDLALVEIPADFQSLKHVDPSLALAWRMQTRGIFERAFASGYMVTGFVFEKSPRRSFYVLTHTEPSQESGADWSIFAGDIVEN